MSKQTGKVKPVNPADIYGSMLDIPEELKLELTKKGLVPRWISAKDFKEQNGFHRSGWMPYKRDQKEKADSLFGGNPEGYVFRRDLVLATKSIADNDRHRAGLAHRTAIKSNDVNKLHAEKLRQGLEANGVKTKVDSKYEMEGDDEAEE